MRRIIFSVLLVVFIIGLVVAFFTWDQVVQEEARLTADLQYRSSLLAEDLRDTVEPYARENFRTGSLPNQVKKFIEKQRLIGTAVYDNKENVIESSPGYPREAIPATELIAQVMDEDKASGKIVKFQNKKLYFFAVPLRVDRSVVGALVVAQNADYIDRYLFGIWRNNLIRFAVQSFLLSLATLLIIRWILFEPVRKIAELIRMIRLGRLNECPDEVKKFSLFKPLINEVSHLSRNLMEARLIASEEARLRLEKLESPWTAQRLQEFVKVILKGRTIFLVSNREPYIHVKEGGEIKSYEPASGMVTALEPMMVSCGGTWIAHGSGNADRLVVDENDRITVPPEDPKYILRRVWLTEEEEKGYYEGFASEGLWPLCHIVHNRPVFRKTDWHQYEKVNGKFAHTVLQEVKEIHKPIVLIQDYHFALLPRMIKRSRPDALVGIFWHIPWPNSESFSICPWRRELLDGMLAADLIGFHTQFHSNNFIETVGRVLESLVDWEQFVVARDGHQSYVKPFPISISFTSGDSAEMGLKESKEAKEEISKKLSLNARYLGVGVERLDYTKGLIEKMRAVELLLEKYPSFRGDFVFIQIAAPSRETIGKYRDFAEEVRTEVSRINAKFKSERWQPIILLEKHHSHFDLQRYYKAADVCLVTSLHDGMNLVAKEFVSSRDDGGGVLVLSQFAGASRDLKESLIVNPYNIEQIVEAVRSALVMLPSEQKKRIIRMRERIRNYNAYRWSAEYLKSLVSLEP